MFTKKVTKNRCSKQSMQNPTPATVGNLLQAMTVADCAARLNFGQFDCVGCVSQQSDLRVVFLRQKYQA